MIKSSIKEYLKIIAVTLLATFVLVIVLLGVVKHDVYNEQRNTSANSDDNEYVDYSLVGVLIQKNIYLEQQSPGNYKINLKLGMLYELKKDYDQAESNYKLAIDKAPYGEYFPQYKLARLYLSLGHLDKAQRVMDDINELPDKQLIKCKANIYKDLGDAYYNLGDYEDAIYKYQKSLSYWHIIKKEKEINEVNSSLASAYVYMAEMSLAKMEPQNAISYFNLALSIVDAPILKYKLALLLMNEQPGLAYQYFDEVFQKQPEIINFDTYAKFLSKLSDEAAMVGETAQAQLYQFKIKKLKEYFNDNILSVKDISITDAHGIVYMNNIFKKYKVYLELKLNNTSKFDIDSLFVFVVIKDGGITIQEYSQQVADEKNVFKKGKPNRIVAMSISGDYKDVNKETLPGTLTADIYVAKTEKSCKLLLKTVDLAKEHKTINKYVRQFAKQFDNLMRKITSKLPAFLF